MEESNCNPISVHGKKVINPFAVKKSKKRSQVERELETNLTTRVTSPMPADGVSTSRYGRARRLKTENDNDGVCVSALKSQGSENRPVQALSNIKDSYPLKTDTPKKALITTLDNIDNIYHENMCLSRFTKDEILTKNPSSATKFQKLYTRTDLIQNRDDDDDDGIVLIKDLFSSPKPGRKSSNHSSSKKYLPNQNGLIDTKSVVKILDFDGKKKKENKVVKVPAKNEQFDDIEATSPYQVGDLAWARMGTFPFWPCILTRDPATETFVRKKLFGRVERYIFHVTFFADNGRRSWVVDNMLRKYMGLEEFLSARQKFTAEDKKKDPKLYAAFFVSEKKESLWNASVKEAEVISREPRTLRIDVFNDMIHRARASKKQQRGCKITRAGSDVSLSESLYDSLFSEDDNKADDANSSRNTTKNIKIDVSDVVTACLDNMAAKSGNIKIQRQSHMDRWLQKAKSKTPEKVKTENNLPTTPYITPKVETLIPPKFGKIPLVKKKTTKMENDTSKNESISKSNKRRLPPKDVKITKAYKLRRPYEAQIALSLEQSESEMLIIKDELDCSLKDKNVVMGKSNDKMFPENYINTNFNVIIPKSEPLVDENSLDNKEQEEVDIAAKKNTDNILFLIDGLIEDKHVDKRNKGSNIICPSENSAETSCITQEENQIYQAEDMEVDECLKNSAVSDSGENNPNATTIVKDDPEELLSDEERDVNNVQVITENQSMSSAKTDNDKKYPTPLPNHKGNSDKTEKENQVENCKILGDKDNNSEDTTMRNNHFNTPVLSEQKLSGSVEFEMDFELKHPVTEVRSSHETENKNIDISSAKIENKLNIVTDSETTLISLELESLGEINSEVAQNVSSAVTDHSPRSFKSNEIVIISDNDITNSDANSSDPGNNTREMTCPQDHNSNIKNSVTMTGIIEFTKKTEDSFITDPNERYVMSRDETIEDHDKELNDKCNLFIESGQSGYILQTDCLSEYTSNKKDETAKTGLNDSTKSESILDISNKGKEIKNIETKPVEDTIVQRIESNPFLDVTDHVDANDKDSVNIFFREVSVNKPPDLKSDNSTGKAELLKNVVEITNEFYEDVDTSDDEPSPEYEPLGDEITEDFRQHMKCIESIITDEKDEAQIVKVCNDMAVIEESKTKVIDTISSISEKDISLTLRIDETQYTKKEVTKPKQIHGETKCEQKNEIAEKEQTIDDTKTSKIIMNGVVRKETDLSFDLIKTVQNHISKEIKSEVINLQQDESKHTKKENKIVENWKSSLGKKKYSLSLKKNKSISEDTNTDENTVLNKRYKTIDQIEEIIQKNTEPKILPIENGEVNITILNKSVYAPTREYSNTPDLPTGDIDFNIDEVSVNSEDSDISLPNTQQNMPRRNLRSRPEKKGGLENPDFLKYLELNQDSWMEQHPDLSPDDIVCYLYKIFLYQEKLTSYDTISDEADSSNLVKGVKQESPDAKIKKKTKKTCQPKNTIENILREKYNNAKKIDLNIRPDSLSDSNEEVLTKREMRSVSPVDSGIGNSKDSNENIPCTRRKTRSISPELQISTPEITKEVKDKLTFEVVKKETKNLFNGSSPKTPKSKKTKSISPRSFQKTAGKRVPVVVISPMKFDIRIREPNAESESIDSDSELPLRQLRSKVIHENSLNDFNKEILQQNVNEEIASQQKTENVDKDLENTYQDPEFIKYLQLRQDAVTDENPQLSMNEIQAYLYKSWLYENMSKSEMQKNEEIESSNLIKGLKPETVPQRKVRRKLKTEKADIQALDEVIPKQKPKRKTVKHYFNEDFVSDIEDEDLFEIFKTGKAPITAVSKAEDKSPIKETINDMKTGKDGDEDADRKVAEVISTEDEIELYFKQLITSKPSVFKGLIREKVCEICEDISNLIKCKGCNGMFHYDCVVAKQTESPKTVLFKKKRGRKTKTVMTDHNESKTGRDENGDERIQDLSEENISMEEECPKDTESKRMKKRRGRKPKSLQDSENSDERSNDISAENVYAEDTTGLAFDAATLEAQLEAKMKELLDGNEQYNYDSYSSDDGVEWTETSPGHCEIIDVKLKKRTQPIDYANFKCNNCVKLEAPVCFVCKSAVSKNGLKYRQKCNMSHCHNYYHSECLDHWPQTQLNAGELTGKKQQTEAFICPRHVCHTCVCDDPRGCKTRFIGDKLAKCVRCPATYHAFNRCLPAGTQILTASLIICPRHYEHRPGKVPCHVNTGWCFICALGGSLICCEYCPTSFHAECLNIKPPDGNYMCEDCETGRLPLYGEMVWVKLGQYRWWPGVVLHPSEIPDNIMAVNHSLGEFVVRFFGQYDHYWVNRGRVFPYQEGDSGRLSGQKSKIDADFAIAMEHAQRAAKILKNAPPDEEEEAEIAASLLPPHYVKLKCNRPIGSLCGKKIEDPSLSLTQCECNPADVEPCGPNSQCLNRMLLTECGPTCRAGERCNNRAFEKRQYPKLTPYRASHRGWGLKTLQDIKAGQFVIEYVGELIDEEEFRRRMTRKHEIRDENFYFLTLDKERMIDAGPKGNLARFMNHCCEPNCETQKWTVLGDIRVGLFAIHDIPANSEVTFNYNLECTGIEKKRCLCGANRCSGYIGAKPKIIDESQKKLKNVVATKRTYKKRKTLEESPSSRRIKKKPVGRPPKPKHLTEIEKDLLIIKNASSEESTSCIDDKPKKKKIDSKSLEEDSMSNETEPTKLLKRKSDPVSYEESSNSKETDPTEVSKKSDCIKDVIPILNRPESSDSQKKLDSNSKQDEPISNELEKKSFLKEDFSATKETEPNKIQKKLNPKLKDKVAIPNGLRRKFKLKDGSLTNGIKNRSLKRKLDSSANRDVSISNEPTSKRLKCGIEVGD